MSTPAQLNSSDHSRDSAGMTYIYPVVSRRAGGISVGINLNPNHACNWRCIYCQVPGLVRGTAPAIDLKLLDQELRQMLTDILQGDFMQQRVGEGARQLEDIAFSGDGEPTSAKEFSQAVVLVDQVIQDFGLTGKIKLRLITNGSLLDRPEVLEGITHLGRSNGEVWFKMDAATTSGIARINDVRLNPQGIIERLHNCAVRCPTWVQTCVFALDGLPPDSTEMDAYTALLQQVASDLAGVHLYGLARPSMQPEASRLTRLSEEWMETLAERIRKLGLTVRASH